MTLPGWVAPQLATLVGAAPEGSDWVHEIKLDGYRVLARIERGRVRLLTRNRQDWTERFPTVEEAAATLPVKEALLDGEIVALDRSGVSSFQALQQGAEGTGGWSLAYVAFDLLFLDGRDLRPQPLLERKKALARLLRDRDGRLVYAGRVGTGFTDATLAVLGQRLRKLAQRASPFSPEGPRPPARGAHWVKPVLVGEVAFTEWTRDGLLRHPAFEGLREDKPAAQVVREAPRAAPARRIAGGSDADVAVAGVHLSHPDRVLYQEQAITKLGLARYYEALADFIVPHVADRPLSLVRCPEGAGGQCFYQKHAGPGIPSEVKRVRIRERGGATAAYPYVDDLPGLVALAQIGVLEIHPWGARVGRIDRPDRLVLDLDPAPGVPWGRVVEGAQAIRGVLGDLDLVSFVKTTGGKGLHLVVPLRPSAGWDALRALGEGIGAGLGRRAPERYTTNPLKAARRGRIFVDYLRNVRGATSVAAYSPRARRGAPVSTPITWAELSAKTELPAFTLETVPKRLATLRKDPWADFFSVDQAITSRTATALAPPAALPPAPRRSGRARSRPGRS